MSNREHNIVETLAAICNVPNGFAQLVVSAETQHEWPHANEQEKMLKRVARTIFLEKVTRVSVPLTGSSDISFAAQCLSIRHGIPIEMAHMVIVAEQGEIIPENKLIRLRDERIVFLSNVFKILIQTVFIAIP